MLKRKISTAIFSLFFVEGAFASFDTSHLNFEHPHVPNQVIIKLKEGARSTFLRDQGVEVKKEFRSSGAVLVEFPKSLTAEIFLEGMQREDAIEYVGLNYIYNLDVTPDDESFERQYAHENIQSERAWSVTTGSRDVKVAVIDTGVDYRHPDLESNYLYNAGEMGLDEEGKDKSTNGIDDDNNGFVDDYKGWDFANNDNDPMDDHGHGTHCAGIIGASGNNSIGVVGVNWEVSMMGIKVFSAGGQTTTEILTSGIEYSTLMGVHITNNSWGGGQRDPSIEAAIQEAHEQKILFVAAAGNNSSDNDSSTFFPANYDYDNVVSVLSTNSRDGRSGFSNYGQSNVDVGAPGSSILSTLPNGRYGSQSGTSMAAPYVTGLLALVMSVYPEEDYIRIKNRVIYSGDTIEGLIERSYSGKRINAANVFEDDTTAPSPVSYFEMTSEGWWWNVWFQYDKAGDDGLEGAANFYDFRWSEEPLTEENWEQAARLPIKGVEELSETRVEIKVRHVFYNRSYIGVKAYDEVGNSAPIKVIEAFE